jgi:hypothetical protein
MVLRSGVRGQRQQALAELAAVLVALQQDAQGSAVAERAADPEARDGDAGVGRRRTSP